MESPNAAISRLLRLSRLVLGPYGVMATGAQVPQAVSPQEVSHRPRDITTAIVRQHSRPDQVQRLLQVTGAYPDPENL